MLEKNARTRVLATALTTLVLTGTFFLARRNQSAPPSSELPEAVISSVLMASREGNVKAYLNCFTGDLERTLRKTAETMGQTQFADYLRQSNHAIKGVAVSEVNRISDNDVSLKVEFVYQDKNEVQEHYLKKVGSDWKIQDINGAARVKTLVPYGTEVTPLLENK